MSGYVKISRELLEHPVVGVAYPERFALWCWLIGNACWKPKRFDVQGKTVTLKRGQICISQRELAKKLGLSRKAVRAALERFEGEEMIGRKKGPSGGTSRAIITVCNYNRYQDVAEEAGPARGPRRAQEGPTKEEGKKGRKEDSSLRSESGGRGAPSKYAWEGSVIRLRAPDYERWRKSYNAIPDFDAALQKADDHYRENPPPDGKWFFPASRFLENEHRRFAGRRPPDSGQSAYGREQARIREELQSELRLGHEPEDDSDVPRLSGPDEFDCQAPGRPALRLVAGTG